MEPAEQTYGTIVVVGGGCYGSYYVRQLRRARDRQALHFHRVIVVDRDAACAVAGELGTDVELVVAEWELFFAEFLGRSAVPGADRDAIVPSPLMPHLLFRWLVDRARVRWPDRHVGVRAPDAVDGIPWQREGADATRYVSFAEWMCPVNCIEPRICPHTRTDRHWSLPPAVAGYVAAARAAGQALDGPAIFHCTHRAYGVGMIDVADIHAAEGLLASAVERGRARLLVGTVSHCHGALSVLEVG